ncbi:hypothetical protein ACVWYN_002676 [Pedobacter sp. UYP24]
MIQIINQFNQVLDLDPATSIPAERKLPLLSDSDSFLQDVTYPGKAGLTENNILFIQSGHLVEAKLSVYELPVRVVISGEPFYAGLFSYKIVSGNIEFLLKVNFGAVATKLKTTLIREILTEDHDFTSSSDTLMEALMKDTCLHPENYPYAFFPVYNNGWNDQDLTQAYPWMNYWDHAAQKFFVKVTGTGGRIGDTIQVPFFKLSFLLTELFKYLEFTLEGEVLQDVTFNSLYLYTRRGLKRYDVNPCFSYFPDKLTIETFVKAIGARLNVNFRFDLLNRKVIAESLVQELAKTAYIDLTDYLEKITELGPNEKKGYTVTLKTDESDNALNLASPDATESVFLPAYSLVVGGGENIVELEVSTLKLKDHTDYVTPEADQVIQINQPELMEWPIRLMTFNGMKSVTGGIFPEAKPFELSADDAAFYRFVSDSKKVIMQANIPPGVLAKMRTCGKIGFKSQQGTFVYAIPAKQSFAFSNSSPDYMAVNIEAQVILSNINTPYSILPVDKPEDTTGGKSIMSFKFAAANGSFAPDEVALIRVANVGSAAIFESYPSKAPADLYGIGGQLGKSFASSGSRIDIRNSGIRIYGQKPQYMLAGGSRITWSTIGGGAYHYPDTSIWSDDGRPLLIVF